MRTRQQGWRTAFEVSERLAMANGDRNAQVIALLGRIAAAGLDFVKTEHLCTFDGQPGFSSGQGE